MQLTMFDTCLKVVGDNTNNGVKGLPGRYFNKEQRELSNSGRKLSV
jgi:hypothetical protein